jgi:molecular chaperone GrpE
VTSPSEEIKQPPTEPEDAGSVDPSEQEDVGAESVVDDELQEMAKALQAAEQELALHREAMLRMQAEMENLRKRLIRDLEKSRKFALEGFMKDLLQVRDSLERGLGMIDEKATVETLKEGKELTLKMLTKVMSDHGLEVVDPALQAFDPEFHEAVTVMPSEEYEENTVLEVLQKGFKLHDRLIRPATVVVAGKP